MGKSNTELLQNSTNYWNFYEHSLELKEAAFEIWPLFEKIIKEGKVETRYLENGLFHVFLNTIAVSIENLIKGRIMWKYQEEGQKFDNLCEIIKKWKGSHKILKLAEENSISFTEIEKELIKELEPYMVWAGRFRLPIHKDEILNELKKSEHGRFAESDFQIISKLFKRMEIEMGIMIK